MSTPTVEHSRHIGTTRMTARGSDQLSYWAASTRKTSTTARANANIAVLPVWSCSKASSVQTDRIDCGSSIGDESLHDLDCLAGADARPGVEVHGGRRVHVVAHDHHGPADLANLGQRAQGHHVAPFVRGLRDRERSSICLRKSASA